ncbi:MAG: VPLPA-CTERM sorting domain-containing protein [Phycisphaerales bacterium]
MRTLAIVAASVAAVVASGAHAAQKTMKFVTVDPGQSVTVKWFNGTAWEEHGTSAGVFKWTNTNGTGAYVTFCCQLNENIGYGGTYLYNCVDPSAVPDGGAGNLPVTPGPMGLVKAQVLKDLYYRFYDTARSGANLGEQQKNAAAFQLCVWEIVHEVIGATESAQDFVTSLGLADGNGDFYVKTGGANAATLALAEGWLDQLGAGGVFNSYDALTGLTNMDNQDQLEVVPIPAPVVLAGLGLIGVAGLRRRMKKA